MKLIQAAGKVAKEHGQTFMSNGKRALYGDNDENHLMISKED